VRAAVAVAVAIAVGGCFDPHPRDATCGPEGECPSGQICSNGAGSACKLPEELCAARRDAAEAACLAAAGGAPGASPVSRAERECVAGVATTVFLTCCAEALDASCGPPPPRCDAVTPVLEDASLANDLNYGFTDYAQSGTTGWTGGDGVYVSLLEDDRLLWTFSDTFLGPVTGTSRPRSARLLNNAFVLQGAEGLTTINSEDSLLPGDSEAGRWYWSADGVTVGAAVDRIFHRFRSTGDGTWSFAFDGNVLARFSMNDLTAPYAVVALPSSQGIAWGSSIIPTRSSEDGYTYVYGVEDVSDEGGPERYMAVARVAGDDLTAPWEYLTARYGWSPDERDAARILGGVSQGYSVQRTTEDRFLLVTQDGSTLFSDQILVRAACAPSGPFTDAVLVYRTREDGPDGEYHNANVYTYNARGHGDLSEGPVVVVSYNVNSLSIDDVYSDVTIYRPRFVRMIFFYVGH
jgi:hypothetical protein